MPAVSRAAPDAGGPARSASPTRPADDTPASRMDTFPTLLLEQARKSPDAPAIRSKKLGVWQVTTWAEARDRVAALAGGLAARGIGEGAKFGVFGPNGTDLYLSYLAAQSLGAVPVPIGTNTYGPDLRRLVDAAEVEAVLASEQQHVDALLECGQERVREILYLDPRGMAGYRQQGLTALDAALDAAAPADLERLAGQRAPDDTAAIVLTSGSTRWERPVELSHAALIATATRVAQRGKIAAGDELMAYLPLSVPSDLLFSFALALVAGCRMNCPESDDTVLQNMQEIGPTVLYAPSYVYKYIFSNASNRIESATDLDAMVYKSALRSVMKVAAHRADGARASPLDHLRFWFARATTFGPFCNVYGLSRLRLALSGGDALSPEVFRFFRAIGIDLRELYGLAEGCACVTMQASEDWNSDSVGQPLADTELRIENGEIWFRGPGRMKGFYGDPQGTAECLQDGWVRTHDAGRLDDRGRLHVLGQVSRRGRLKRGTEFIPNVFMPNVVESELRSSAHIKQAYVHGDGHEHLVALLAIDGDTARTWADRRNLRYTGYQDLSMHPAVQELVREQVQRVNEKLARRADFEGIEIRRFALFHREFHTSAGEVTTTRKLRAYAIEEKFRGLLDALYSDALEYTYTDPSDGVEYTQPLGNV